jgi:hypothetical protein
VAGGGSGSAAQRRPALIIDLNLPPALVDKLADRGFACAHWSTLGPLDALDEAVLAQVRLQDLAASSVALTIERIVAEHAQVLQDGALVSVREAGARVHVLPLRRR